MGAARDQVTGDVLVIGGGVAGCSAALSAAGQGLSVTLVDRLSSTGLGDPRPDWLAAPALALLDELEVPRKGWLGEAFSMAFFHSADLTRTAQSKLAGQAGYRIDYAALVKALRKQAAKAGVAMVEGVDLAALEVTEASVTAMPAEPGEGESETTSMAGAFSLLADGAAGSLLEMPAAVPRWVATATLPCRKRDADGGLHWVLGLGEGDALGLWWFDGTRRVVQLHGAGELDTARGAFLAFVDSLRGGGVLPDDVPVDPDGLHVRPAAPRLALEIDSHVSKRTLLIGDAGGFVSAASHEGIYASLWSARLAVDAVARAMKSPHPQDELRTFGRAWRTTMADYLRPPNTDMQFLLPLIFTNQQIADRMAAAFWTGENI